jgi:hypothetical protein
MDQLNVGVAVSKGNTTTLKREKFVMLKSSPDMADSRGIFTERKELMTCLTLWHQSFTFKF